MLRLIDILIILSEISAARAGPLRRYVNTTCTQEASDTMTGVAYQPYAGSPSLSLGPIQGITSLPFSQLIESPTDASSTGPRSSQTDASSIAPTTRANPSLSQPPRTGSSGLAMSTSTTSVTKSDSIPTSFSTFGGQHADTTVTITTLSYTTVQAPPSAANSQSSQAVRSSQAQTDAIPTAFSTFGGKPADTTVTVTKTAYTTLSAAPHVAESQSSQNVHSSQAEDTTDTSADITVTKTTTTYTTFSVPPHVGASQSSQEVQSSQAKNTASTSATDSSPTFVYDPLPTATSDVITTSGTSTKATSSSSNAQHTDSTSELDNPQPLPSSLATTTSSAQSTQQNEDPEPSPTSSPDTVPPLPEVVNGNPSSTQATFNTTSSATTAPPGITIVPQNPSVIYITVTDAGATTTVTDSGDTKTANERWAMSTVIADWARGNPFERRAWHLGQR